MTGNPSQEAGAHRLRALYQEAEAAMVRAIEQAPGPFKDRLRAALAPVHGCLGELVSANEYVRAQARLNQRQISAILGALGQIGVHPQEAAAPDGDPAPVPRT